MHSIIIEGLEECTKHHFPLVGLKFLHLTVHFYIELETVIKIIIYYLKTSKILCDAYVEKIELNL